MKKSLFPIAVILILALNSCANSNSISIKGDEEITKKEYSISDYNQIKIGGGKTIIYKQVETDVPYLVIETDKNLQEYVEVSVSNGILRVQTKSDTPINPSTFIIYTSSKQLNSINLSGATRFETTDPIKTENLSIEASGASKVFFSNTTEITSFDCSISGASKINLEGDVTCKTLDIGVSGASKGRLNKISTDSLMCDTSGASSVSIAGKATNAYLDCFGASKIKAEELISESLECDASGASKIFCKAPAKFKESANGGSKIIVVGTSN